MGKLSKLKNALDMSTAARMARAAEQGFDLDAPIYHATSDDIKAFRFNKLGSNTAENSGGSKWADNLAKLGFWHSDKDITPKMGGSVVMKNVASGDAYHYPSLDVLEYQIRQSGGPAKFRKRLVDDGYSMVTVNDEEFGGLSTVVLNPSDVRSVNAAFDPANIGKNDLLGAATVGGMATAGVLGGAALVAQNQWGDSPREQAVYADFARRRQEKSGMWKQLKEALFTVGSAIPAGIVSDAYRLGGYLLPNYSVERTEQGAQQVQNALTYQPTEENRYLNAMAREIDQFGDDLEPLTNAFQQTPIYKGYKALPERAQGIARIATDYAF